jgi:hypothetical protein
VPNLAELCPRAEVAAYTAPANQCIALRSVHDTLFKLSDSDSCGGPPVLCVRPGETAYALERIKPGQPAVWSYEYNDCSALPECQ